MTVRTIHDDFIDSRLKNEIWDDQKLQPGSIGLNPDRKTDGRTSIEITLRPGDGLKQDCAYSPPSERDELLERKALGPVEGATYFYGFGVYLPEDFPVLDNRLVLAQWKQHHGPGVSLISPPLAVRYVNGDFFITLQTSEDRKVLYKTDEEVRGRWIDLDFLFSFRRDDQGHINTWMEGQKIIDFNGNTCYSEEHGYTGPSKFYFKMGLYRDTLPIPMTAHFSDFRKCAYSLPITVQKK